MIKTTPILYTTGTTEGRPLIGGIWTMKRQEGFPVELSILEIKERGGVPDYCEMLADAGAVSPPAYEFDAARQELQYVIPQESDDVMSRFMAAFFAAKLDGEEFRETCARMLLKKGRAR